MNILVIGCGNMGLTYAQSIQKNFDKANISALENNKERVNVLKETTSFNVFTQPEECVANANMILLAIKPQGSKAVFESIKPFVKKSQVILSIMAGVTIDTIKQSLECPKVVRAMPNLPAQVGFGVTGYTAAKAVTGIELEYIAQILGATGTAVEVKNENEIDAITALSGSGPAYVFYFMEAMMKQAETFGFNESQAKDIVVNTFLGTAELFKNSETDAQTWMDKVTSKGGTTHAALTSFKNNNLNEKIKQGVDEAFKRAKELAKN